MGQGIDLMIRISRRILEKAFVRHGTSVDAAMDRFDKDDECKDLSVGDRTTMLTYGWWYECGMQRIVIGHRHAASLMCTTMPREIVRALPDPWPVWCLDIPDKMIMRPGTREWLTHAFVISAPPDGAAVTCTTESPFVDCFSISARDIADLGDHCDAYDGFDTESKAAARLLARYVEGALAELSARRPALAPSRSSVSVKRDTRGNPVTNTVVITRPVTVDCRPYVAAVMAGERRNSPTVQSLVMGHWKQQVCGVGRADRKHIQVAPYWRGPEDAPIAVRPHVIVEPSQ